MGGLNITVLTSVGHRGGGKTIASAVEQVAAVLSMGATIAVGATVAGPIGDGLWSCRNKRGAVPALSWLPVTVPLFQRIEAIGKRRTVYFPDRADEMMRDFSAFGAAREFVREVGEKRALVAVKAARAAAANAKKTSDNVIVSDQGKATVQRNVSAADVSPESRPHAGSPLLAAIAALCGGCVPGDLNITSLAAFIVGIFVGVASAKAARL